MHKRATAFALLGVLILSGCGTVSYQSTEEENAAQIRQRIDQGEASVPIGKHLDIGEVRFYPYLSAEAATASPVPPQAGAQPAVQNPAAGNCSLPPGLNVEITNIAGVRYRVICHERHFHWQRVGDRR